MSNERKPERSDVVIVGAGPAGLAAGVFTARYGLRTRIFDRGPSLLKQCAYLDNYLGFPSGIDPAEFLGLAKTHALEAGCTMTAARVTAVVRASGRFLVRTRSAEFAAERVIVASGYESEYLREFAHEGLFDERGELRADERGRTCCEGLYSAGPLAGIEDQALVSAGHGARVALAVISDARSARFSWKPLARHLDWQVREGVYDTERWSSRVHTYFRTECQPAESEEADFRVLVDDWIRDKRKQQIARVEVVRRRSRAARLRAAAAAVVPAPSEAVNDQHSETP